MGFRDGIKVAAEREKLKRVFEESADLTKVLMQSSDAAAARHNQLIALWNDLDPQSEADRQEYQRLSSKIQSIQAEYKELTGQSVNRGIDLRNQLANTPSKDYGSLLPLLAEIRELQTQELEVTKPLRFDLAKQRDDALFELEQFIAGVRER